MTLIKPGTFSKDEVAWGLSGISPIKQVAGPSVLCADDKWRIDWTSSLGQWIFGQTPEFLDYMGRAVRNGLSGTLPFWQEVAVAERLGELLSDHVPGWQGLDIGVRFGKSGSDVTTAAVRLARAVTGRETVIAFKGHYHGWGDWTVSRTPPAWGVVGAIHDTAPMAHRVVEAEWGNAQSLNRLTGYEPAAVIFEHPADDPGQEWVKFIRDFCNRTGALLIADEVVCWPRYSLGGASGLYGYEPDLVCLGKALGNGAAVSALAGPADLMKRFGGSSPVFWSSTTNGNPVDLSAALYVLDQFNEVKLDRLWSIGEEIKAALESVGLNIKGHAPRMVVNWTSKDHHSLFVKLMAERGNLFNRPIIPNLAMGKIQLDVLRQVSRETVKAIEAMGPDEVRRLAQPYPKVLFDER